jgi:hypothetical protein
VCERARATSSPSSLSSIDRGRVVHLFKKVKRLVPEPLVMPTRITGQNGAVERQTTKIAVTGCAKAKRVKKRPAPERTASETGRSRTEFQIVE